MRVFVGCRRRRRSKTGNEGVDRGCQGATSTPVRVNETQGETDARYPPGGTTPNGKDTGITPIVDSLVESLTHKKTESDPIWVRKDSALYPILV